MCSMIIGNCWFLAAVGAVTLHPDLLERVVPPNQSFDRYEYGGMHCLALGREMCSSSILFL